MISDVAYLYGGLPAMVVRSAGEPITYIAGNEIKFGYLIGSVCYGDDRDGTWSPRLSVRVLRDGGARYRARSARLELPPLPSWQQIRMCN